VFVYSSAQEVSSPESSDSGIQTDHHNSTSHIDALLTYTMTSSSSCGHHGNGVHGNNNDDDDDVVNDNNNNNNNSQLATEVKRLID